MDADERRARLALNALAGLGPSGVKALLAEAGSARTVVQHPERFVGRLRRTPPGWSRAGLRAAGAREEAALRDCGARSLVQGEAGYPPRLEHLEHPPPALAVLGAAGILQGAARTVTVVGARACTPYGRSQARRFGGALARAGAVVVSGAARGIDQAAMEGAVDSGGAVVAVLGSGIDCPYPPEARPLLERIVRAGGAVLSEFACGSRPARGNFPRRNRILAALAHVVLVVQATRKSGSMITAGWALDLGRDVFALPGPVDCPASAGAHLLLQDGAGVAASPDCLLDAGSQGAPECAAPGASPVLSQLEDGALGIEDLAQRLERPADAVLLELVELELRGSILRRPGGLYDRADRAG